VAIKAGFARYAGAILRSWKRGDGRRRQPRGVVPEPLERRRLFASATLSGGVLTINGDSSGDTIIVYLYDGAQNDNIYVIINGSSPPYGGFDAANVNRIDIYPNLGNDTVTIEDDASYVHGNLGGVNENTRVFCEAGNDTVNGGDYSDEIHGEMGDDTLDGRGGNDTIYGGYGGDDTADSFGNDVLTGGAGTDLMYGGPGDDTFHASDGESDTIDGGSGSDTASDRDFDLDTVYNLP
jgi:Ca2+-binding RTX toxin-like protein